MKDRLYLLLDVESEKGSEVARRIATAPGVVSADILEDESEVMVVIEAEDRRQLAARAVQVITSVEGSTTGVRLLPVQKHSSFVLCPS